jgi:hypothetical protein
MSPAIIATPDIDKALIELKKPPILQPKDSDDPIPIRIPPITPFDNSLPGALRIWNCFARSAEAKAPAIIPKFKIEVE